VSEERDLDDVHHYIVPESQVDDLLAGREVAGEVSEGVTNISGLFAVLRQPPDVDEQMSAASLQRLVSMVGAHPDIDVSPRRAEMQPRIRKTKVTALAVALTLCTAGAAAAATGNLPGPLNWANSSGATHVAANAADAKADGSPSVTGLDNALNRITDAKTVPATTSRSTIASTTNPATTKPSTTTKPSATTDPSTSTLGSPTRYPPTTADASATQTAQPVGPDATGPAKHGLCNAYLDSLAKGHPKNPEAIAFRNLIAAATAAGQTVEQFCATTSPPTTTPPSTTVQTTTLPSTTEVATSPPSSKANGSGGNGNGSGGSGGGASNGAHDSGGTASAAGSSNGQGHRKP